MGYITRLPTAGAATLPTLGDIGYISKQNLKGLYLVNGGSGLVDASGNGNTLTQSAGSILPPYAAGVLQFRIANTQQLNTGVTVTGPNQTIIVASKKLSAPTNGMFLGCHKTAQLAGSNAGPMTMFEGSNGSNGSQAQSWGLQAKRPTVNYSGNLVGSWAVWVATRDASGTSLSLNGQAPVTEGDS